MRLRFTIRDLLWLTLVMALIVGWWVNNRQLTSQLLAEHHRADNLEESNQILNIELKDLNKAHIELKDQLLETVRTLRPANPPKSP